jgi:hypothetical protein
MTPIGCSRRWPRFTFAARRRQPAWPTGFSRRSRPAFDPASSWWVRVTTLAAVVLLGFGLALVSPHDVIFIAADAASVTGRVLHDAVASIGAALGVWKASLDLLAALGRAAGLVFTTGPMPFLIAANLAVASAAFLGLRRVLAPREECV